MAPTSMRLTTSRDHYVGNTLFTKLKNYAFGVITYGVSSTPNFI